MTQRIVNQPSEELAAVLVKHLSEWPKEWGSWAVSSRVAGGDTVVWFCQRQPRHDRNSGWLDIGTVEVFLDALPCDHLHAVVTREYWLAHGLKSPNRLIAGIVGGGEPKVESQGTQCEYYECPVDYPQNPRQGEVAYIANCEDLIQALGMTFDEGCEFKSLWRRARARQGFVKAESTAVRDAAKAVHYAQRILAYELRKEKG